MVWMKAEMRVALMAELMAGCLVCAMVEWKGPLKAVQMADLLGWMLAA